MMSRLTHESLGRLLKPKSTLFQDLDDLRLRLEWYQDVVREVCCDEEDRTVTGQ